MHGRRRSLGVFANGGYGTHVIAPHPRHLVDPGSLDPAVAATYACSGITVYSAIKKAMPLKPTQPIVLVGAGGLGLNAIAVLKALKHENIISVDISAEKRDAAMKAGATKTVDGSGEGATVTKRIMEAAGGPVAAVIDLVNGTATARFAFGALDKGGKLIQVGLFGGELTLALPIMAMRALTVQGSYVGNPKELRELVQAGAGRRPGGAAGRHHPAKPGERGAEPPARRQGHRPPRPESRGRVMANRRSPPLGRAEKAPARRADPGRFRHPGRCDSQLPVPDEVVTRTSGCRSTRTCAAACGRNKPTPSPSRSARS